MMETTHPICHDDTENRPKHDDNGQGNYRRVQRRTGDKNERHFHLSSRRKSSNRNDENGERQRPEQNEHQPAILTILPPFYTKKKFDSRADVFGIVREPNETAEDVWTRILQTKIANLTTLQQPSSLHRSSYH